MHKKAPLLYRVSAFLLAMLIAAGSGPQAVSFASDIPPDTAVSESSLESIPENAESFAPESQPEEEPVETQNPDESSNTDSAPQSPADEEQAGNVLVLNNQWDIRLAGNAYIEMGDDFLVFENENDVIANWTIKENSVLEYVTVEGGGDSIQLTETGDFEFHGQTCSFTVKNGKYTMRIEDVSYDLSIFVRGKSTLPPSGDVNGAQLSINRWIEADPDKALSMEGTTLAVTWKVKDGGIFTKAVIEGQTETAEVTAPGKFNFAGQECTLSESSGSYVMRIPKAPADLSITVYGEEENPQGPTAVKVAVNDWVLLDTENDIKIEDGTVTVSWKIKDKGVFSSAVVSGGGDSVRVEQTGNFLLNGKNCSLTLADGTYTLRAEQAPPDISMSIYGKEKNASMPDGDILIQYATNEWVASIEGKVDGKIGENTVTITWAMVERSVFTNAHLENANGEKRELSGPESFQFDGQPCSLVLQDGIYTLTLTNVRSDLYLSVFGESDPISIQFGNNDWIEMDRLHGPTIQDGVLFVPWSVKEQAVFAQVVLKSKSGKDLAVTKPGSFTFEGGKGELEVSGRDYTLRFDSPKLLAAVIAYGMPEPPPLPPPSDFNVNVSANRWIQMDPDTALTIDDMGNVTLIWNVVEGGRFRETTISGMEEILTLTEPGEYSFGGKNCSLSLSEGIYTLRIAEVDSDISIAVYGEKEQEQVSIRYGGNIWITFDPDNPIKVEETDVVLTWSIKEGGRFREISLEGAETMMVNQLGSFEYGGQPASLQLVDGNYILRLRKNSGIALILVYGEPVPVRPVKVTVNKNEWIEMDPENGLQFENGEAKAVWSIKKDGKFDSVTIENEDGKTTITEPGPFTFQEQTGVLKQTDGTFELVLSNIQKDTTISIAGVTTLPEKVTVQVRIRKHLLVGGDNFETEMEGPGGADIPVSFQFTEGLIIRSFDVQVGDSINTIPPTEGEFTVGNQVYYLEETLGPTQRPVYIIHLNHLVEDAVITPNYDHTVFVKCNNPALISMQTSDTVIASDYGTATVRWKMMPKSKIDEITLSMGSETKKISPENQTFSLGTAKGTLSVASGQYTLTFENIPHPIVASVSASDDVIFGGFELSKDKELVPFAPTVGIGKNHSFGLSVSYQTREDGSVLIQHNASQSSYHGGGAKILYQSHKNGEVIEQLKTPITVTVRVQCTQGCGTIGEASVSIPYRQLDMVFRDERGELLQRPSEVSESCFAMDNRTYFFHPPSIAWHEYTPKSGSLANTAPATKMLEADGKVYFSLDENERGKLTVQYRARARVNFQYLDDLNAPIPFPNATASIDGYRDDLKTVPVPSGKWYEYVSTSLTTSGSTPSGTIKSKDSGKTQLQLNIGGDSTVTIRYRAKAQVKVQYVDELGNPIDALVTAPDKLTLVSGYRGDKYKVPVPEIKDYVYQTMYVQTASGQTPSGVVNTSSQTLTLGFEDASTLYIVYQPKASVSVRYVDELGNPIDMLMPPGTVTKIEGLRGESFPVAVPHLDDYDFKDMSLTTPENEQQSGRLTYDGYSYAVTLDIRYASTITLVYHAKASFRVEYVDDLGQNINSIVPSGTPFEYTGHRGDTVTIPVPELEDYQFNSMSVYHSGPSGRPNESVTLDPDTHTAVMQQGYNSVVQVKYDYRATVYLNYEDKSGKDISGVFQPENPAYLEGFRNRTAEIPHPETGPYIFDHFEIETLPNQEPSGYLYGSPQDPTLTFGVREASTATVVYRWIDLGIELTGISFEGKPLEDGQTLHLSQGAAYTWTVTNHGTAPCYPEVEFQFPSYLLFSSRTPGSAITSAPLPEQAGSAMTSARIKLDKLLQPGECADFVTLFQVDTVDTYELAKILAVIPESQQDSNQNSYPDIDLSNNFALGELEIVNPPVVITKVNAQNPSEKLAGCYIEIYNEDDAMVWEGWSDENGAFYVTGLRPGEYQIYERCAPDGFAREKLFWPLTVKGDMTARGRQIADQPVRIAIKKISAFTGEALEGAVFGLYNEAGKLVETQTSGADGMLYFERLSPGNYTVEELQAPAGFMASGKIIHLNITDKYVNQEEPYVVRNAGTVNTGIGPVPIFLGPAAGIAAFGGAVLLLVFKNGSKKQKDSNNV